jgi:hypothetical protein
MRIRSRYEVALVIPDLETDGSLDPDPRKVAQRWPESDPTNGFEITDRSQITFNNFEFCGFLTDSAFYRIGLQTDRF